MRVCVYALMSVCKYSTLWDIKPLFTVVGSAFSQIASSQCRLVLYMNVCADDGFSQAAHFRHKPLLHWPFKAVSQQLFGPAVLCKQYEIGMRGSMLTLFKATPRCSVRGWFYPSICVKDLMSCVVKFIYPCYATLYSILNTVYSNKYNFDPLLDPSDDVSP